MEPILTSVISALVAGATAKARDIASQVVSDAYAGLKSLIIRKLGKSGAVQSVEDEPESDPASEALAEALAKQGLASDGELARQAEQVINAIAEAKSAAAVGAGDIEIDSVRGRVNATVERLVAAGRIKLGPIVAEQGDATLRDLSAGVGSKKP
jgi:hypothetical protein